MNVLVDCERQQVRIREVAIVVRFLLAAHRARLVAAGIVEARFLHDAAAALDQLDLARDLVIDRAFDEPEGIHVLDLAARAVLAPALVAHGDVRVAAERALLHVAVADPEVAHQRVDLLHVRDRLAGRAQVRLGNDLEKRRPRPIEVDSARAAEPLVQGLAGVFLEVRARDADDLARPVLEQDLDRAVLDDGLLVLADLVALRQVRVEVVLAREDRSPRDRRADRKPELDGHAHGLAIQHGKHARIAEVHQVGLRVRRAAIGRRRAREDLRARRELRVDLEADDCFPLDGHGAHANAGGSRRCQSVARCQACAAASRRSSEKCGPMTCSPTGNPSTSPQGTETAGRPARFAPIV